jgi:hypothetical protein
MLHGLKGNSISDLHKTVEHGIFGIQQQQQNQPEGLFSNPFFQGQKSSMKYGRIFSNPNEIAGHHIVFSINQNNNELRVKAVPLDHHRSTRTSVFEVSDRIDANWLINLPLSIEEDQAILQHMRFSTEKSQNAHWTCPLRLMQLWSAQNTSFLPSVPNPLRASRIYGDTVLPYTALYDINTHPTTKAQVIDHDTRLYRDYWTTNGFCVYSTSLLTNNENCSLFALAKSVFTEEYMDYTTNFASTCIDQV